MSQNDKTALIHRWPSKFVQRLKVVAEDQMVPVQSLVFNLIRKDIEKEYSRITADTEEAVSR